MPAYKQQNGTWICKYAYKERNGKFKHITKRGFTTKREALEWEVESKRKTHGTIDLKIKDFALIYLEYIKPRIKISTYITKENIFNKMIITYLGEIKLNCLSTKDVIEWQNILLSLKGKGGQLYSKPYLKLIHTELNSMLAYAVKYHDLPMNAAHMAGSIGSDAERKMHIWTKDEYTRFAEVMMDKPMLYYAFEMLYFLGIREGELLALEASDIDFDKKEVSITKTYHRLNRKDIITSPKTRRSNRKVSMPDFLCDEMKEYIELVYEKPEGHSRLFPIHKSVLTKVIQKGADKAGLQRIRVHDLRHSHVSLLIEMGYSAVAIAERMGHESIHITYKYAHLFPNTQKKMADSINRLVEKDADNEK